MPPPSRTIITTGGATSTQSRSSALLASSSRRHKRRRRRVGNEHNKPTYDYCNTGNLCLFLLALLAMTMMIVVNLRFHRQHYNSTQQQQQKQLHLLSGKAGGRQMVKTSRKGEVLHHIISNVTVEDLKRLGVVDVSKTNTLLQQQQQQYNNVTWEEALKGREEIVRLLQEAGVTEMDVATLLLLPKWETVVKLYGSEPVIHGMEQWCEYYQNTIPRNDASLGVAGIFNTGTNLLAMYLSSNCRMPENPQRNRGMRWQVPWGKHILASYKWNNTAKNDGRQNKTNVLPVVLVRDPYSWMNSMCVHPYAAKWHHSPQHCPNLVPNRHDYALYPHKGPNVPVRIRFSKEKNIVHYWPSLAHVWTDWNRLYYHADYPRLMVRFEDLIFHPRQLTERVCACGGAVPLEDEFTYVVDTAKFGPGHGRQAKTNLISAMIKYGDEKRRLEQFTPEDLELAHEALDHELMRTFHYHMPLGKAQQKMVG